VSSTVTLTAGALVPDGCVVAAGAVVPKALSEPDTLYGGVPAKPIADLSGSAHSRRSAPRFAR
jgi:maltose O-acetyltransferase